MSFSEPHIACDEMPSTSINSIGFSPVGFCFCIKASTLGWFGLREGFLFLDKRAPVHVAGKEHDKCKDYDRDSF